MSNIQVNELRTVTRQLSVEITPEMQKRALAEFLTPQMKKIFGPWGRRAEIEQAILRDLEKQEGFTAFTLTVNYNEARVINDHTPKPRKPRTKKENTQEAAQEEKQAQPLLMETVPA